MATGFRHLALDGFRPAGDLTYIAVADEEALRHPRRPLAVRPTHADDVRADFVITESGGFPMGGADGLPRLPVIVGEKGVFWCILTVKGTPGHGSASPCAPTTPWSRRPRSSGGSTSTGRRPSCTRPGSGSSRASASRPSWPSRCSTPTASTTSATSCPCSAWPARPMPAPTPPWPRRSCTAGTKVNVIPDRVELTVDIRVAARVGHRRRAGHAGRRARRPGRRRGDRLPVRGAGVHLADRHPAVGRPAAGQPALLSRGRARCPT